MSEEMIEVERKGFEALLADSKDLVAFGYSLAALVESICPEHRREIMDLYCEHHNANCGPLHRWAEEKLKSKEEEGR